MSYQTLFDSQQYENNDLIVGVGSLQPSIYPQYFRGPYEKPNDLTGWTQITILGMAAYLSDSSPYSVPTDDELTAFLWPWMVRNARDEKMYSFMSSRDAISYSPIVFNGVSYSTLPEAHSAMQNSYIAINALIARSELPGDEFVFDVNGIANQLSNSDARTLFENITIRNRECSNKYTQKLSAVTAARDAYLPIQNKTLSNTLAALGEILSVQW